MKPSIYRPDNLQPLIDKVKEGDEYAFRLLYTSLADAMFCTCLKHTNSRHDAEDCLQEGFIKLYKYIKSYRGLGSFEGWARQIFINACRNYTRSCMRRRKYITMPQAELPEKAVPPCDRVAVKELFTLIDELPDGRRSVFYLNMIEGYNIDEVSDMMGIKKSTGKSQLYRARAELQKKILSEEAGGFVQS